MLDQFVAGQVERISPEAPIPILRFPSERRMIGGADNVARNVVALGGPASLVGALGQGDTVVRADIVISWGGKVARVPLESGQSTGAIVARAPHGGS